MFISAAMSSLFVQSDGPTEILGLYFLWIRCTAGLAAVGNQAQGAVET